MYFMYIMYTNVYAYVDINFINYMHKHDILHIYTYTFTI